MGKILHRYIFREILVPFLLGLGVFTFVLLIARLLKLIELVVNRGVPATSILRALRLHHAGVPRGHRPHGHAARDPRRLRPPLRRLRDGGAPQLGPEPLPAHRPVAIFVVLATVATGGLALYARPWGNRASARPSSRSPDAGQRRHEASRCSTTSSRAWSSTPSRSTPTTDASRHVLISDERDPQQRNTIFAREGVMVSDAETRDRHAAPARRLHPHDATPRRARATRPSSRPTT